jgi:hypothetical protein
VIDFSEYANGILSMLNRKRLEAISYEGKTRASLENRCIRNNGYYVLAKSYPNWI